MLTTELFIAIISLCIITCFALGYAVGSKTMIKHKNNRPVSKLWRLFFKNQIDIGLTIYR